MSQESYRNLLLDWDGTIQQSLPIWCNSCQVHLNSRQIDLPVTTIARQIIPRLANSADYGVTDLEAFISAVVNQAIESVVQAPLHLELWQTLQSLKIQGVMQAIVSSSNYALISDSLIYHKCDPDHFACIIAREQVSATKPNPEPLLMAMDSLNALSEQTLMIGDSPADIQAAHNAGVDSVWFYPIENEIYYDYAEIISLEPTYIARTPQELAQIVTQT